MELTGCWRAPPVSPARRPFAACGGIVAHMWKGRLHDETPRAAAADVVESRPYRDRAPGVAYNSQTRTCAAKETGDERVPGRRLYLRGVWKFKKFFAIFPPPPVRRIPPERGEHFPVDSLTPQTMFAVSTASCCAVDRAGGASPSRPEGESCSPFQT